MIKFFNSDELDEVQVYGTFEGQTTESITCDEGYYNFEIPTQVSSSEGQLWHNVTIEAEGVKTIGEIQIPHSTTNLGIISDIDDTILQTDAANIIKMMVNTFTKNSQTRLTFPGVKELYKGLQKGKLGTELNPIFYLSNSPWNLYDFLDEFIEINGIPKGSILLRDFGFDNDKIIADSGHKLKTTEKLIHFYPNMKFILIGDSGEKDPEYYQEIAEKYPKRIKAIYIRDVSKDKRDEEVKTIAKKLKEELKIPMIYSETSSEAAEHAYEQGLISEEVLESIKSSISKE